MYANITMRFNYDFFDMVKKLQAFYSKNQPGI